MRIVSWNCRQGFDAKANALLALAPDLAVVPESHKSPAIARTTLLDRPVPHLWVGTIPQRGLGLFAPSAKSLDYVAPDRPGPEEYGIAGRAVHGAVETSVLGVWTIPAAGSGDRYLTAASGIVERHAKTLMSGHTILAGDFNVSGRTCLAGLTNFAQELNERFGLVSAYHAHFGVPIGAESAGTLWWNYHEEQPYHCDFVFVPEAWKITSVEVGCFAKWGTADATARSDHAPLIVDIVR